MTEEVTEAPVTLATQGASQEPKVDGVKRPRTPAQMAALDSARKKALAMRAERAAQRKEPESSEPDGVQEEVEYVRKTKVRPKQKRRIVVVEKSSSEEEIEVRLPKRRPAIEAVSHKEAKFEESLKKMFSL